MATLTKQNIPTTGLAASYVACAAGGDKVAPGSNSFIHVKNAHTGSWIVTLVTPQTFEGDLTVQDRNVTVPNGGERFIAVPDSYRDPADGLASITYNGVTALTIASLGV